MINYGIMCLLALGMVMGLNSAAKTRNIEGIKPGAAIGCVITAPICIGGVLGIFIVSQLDKGSK